jgi:4-carboxymuconolactone decarboxylase
MLGRQGTSELIYLIGTYCLLSILLNAYDVPVPGRDTENTEPARYRNE